MKILFSFLLLLGAPVYAAPNIDNMGDWYYPQWLAETPHAPVFKVRDTVNKYGRYARSIS